MAKELTPTAQYVTTTCPEGGDPRTAASVEVGLQDLSDSVEFAIDSDLYVNCLSAMFFSDGFLSEVNLTGIPTGVVQQAVAGSELVVFAVPVPMTACKITQVVCNYNPLTGRGGVPASKPSLVLGRTAASTADNVIATVTEDAATLGAYEVAQELVLNISHTIIPAEAYYIVFSGESGANAQTGLTITRMVVRVRPV